jgi:hypothetical protein
MRQMIIQDFEGRLPDIDAPVLHISLDAPTLFH